MIRQSRIRSTLITRWKTTRSNAIAPDTKASRTHTRPRSTIPFVFPSTSPRVREQRRAKKRRTFSVGLQNSGQTNRVLFVTKVFVTKATKPFAQHVQNAVGIGEDVLIGGDQASASHRSLVIQRGRISSHACRKWMRGICIKW